MNLILMNFGCFAFGLSSCCRKRFHNKCHTLITSIPPTENVQNVWMTHKLLFNMYRLADACGQFIDDQFTH